MDMNRRWAFARGIALLLLAGAAFLIMLRKFEHSQVYHPDRTVPNLRLGLGRHSEDVFFHAKDGTRLNGWFFSAEPAATNAPTILFCHGNGGNISHRVQMCAAMLKCGVNVFVFDYRGYGLSDGTPSEAGTYLDAQGAYDWLLARGCARVVAYGESLGGGVAAELALREKLAGLVLQSTFTSIPDAGAEIFPWLPVRWLAKIRYDVHSKLPNITAPVMVMHSRSDTLVRYHHAERNYTVARQPKMLWEIKGDHNDALMDEENFLRGLRKFLELCGEGSSG